MNTVILIAIAAICAAIMRLVYRRVMRTTHARRLDRASFPDGLRLKVRQAYPHLSDEQVSLVIEGLRDFFHLCNLAGKRMVAMPSQVVDVAWHEFILNTRRYQRFCRQNLGRFLHHTPAEAMQSPTHAQVSIKRAWRLACQREGIASKSPDRLPRLFSLDSELNISDGFCYRLDCKSGRARDGKSYCASHIGCGGGCGGDSDRGCSSDSDSGCGGGCGGGD